MPFFSLGGANHERVVVTVLRHERAVAAAAPGDASFAQDRQRIQNGSSGNSNHTDHGSNWLAVEVAVWAGSFSAQFPAVFLADHFARFHNALLPLLHTSQGEATFSTREEQLFLRVVGNNNDQGSMQVAGVALAWPGEGEKCEFRLALDRASLARTLRELAQLLATFPAAHSPTGC